MTPLIGITPNIIRHKAWAPLQYGQNDTYVDAILSTGGLPIILPLTDDLAVLRELYDRLGGILLAGGKDYKSRYRRHPLSRYQHHLSRRPRPF